MSTRLLVLRLTLLVLVTLTTTGVHGQPIPLPPGMPTNLTIGFSAPLTKKVDGSALPAAVIFGQPGLFCFNIAINEINNSTDWLPHTQLQTAVRDTKFDEGAGISAALDFAAMGAVAMIGDMNDITAIPAVLKRYRLPQISPNSYITEFSRYHGLLYPYFMRNNYPLTTIGHETMRLLQALGYKRASIIYSNEGFSVSGSIAYFSLAKQFGIELVGNPNYFAGETDWSSVISRIVKSEARIILWLGSVVDMQSIWRYAIQQEGLNNIVGDGYLWIMTYTNIGSIVTHDATGKVIPELAQAAAGHIGLMVVDNSAIPEVQAFKQLYHSTPYTNISTPSVHPENLAIPPASTCQFVYDAVWQAARALHQLIYVEQVDPTLFANRPHLMSTLLNITFTGASGSVVLDSTGDRQTNFAIANYKRASSTFERVGYLGPGAVPTITFDAGKSFEWPGIDPTVQPLDTPAHTLKLISSNVKTALIVVSSIIMGMCFLVQVAVIVYRDHRVMKASSPTFLLIYLVGVQLLCASVIPRAFESEPSTSPSPCNADLYLANIGYTLLVGALLVKTARLQMIFNAQKLSVTSGLSDGRLIGVLGVLLLVEVGMLLGLSEGAKMTIQLRSWSDADLQDYYVCHTNNQSANELNTIYLPVIMATRFALLLVTTFYVFRVRNLPDTFNESKQLGMTIYNLLFLSVLLPAIDGTLGRGQDTPLIAYSVSVFIICVASVGILFVPKFLTMFSVLAPNEGNTQTGVTHSPGDQKKTTAMAHGGMTSNSDERSPALSFTSATQPPRGSSVVKANSPKPLPVTNKPNKSVAIHLDEGVGSGAATSSVPVTSDSVAIEMSEPSVQPGSPVSPSGAVEVDPAEEA